MLQKSYKRPIFQKDPRLLLATVYLEQLYYYKPRTSNHIFP